MKQLHEIAMETLRRRGIDPDAPVTEPPPFDPDLWRLEQAEAALVDATPERFAELRVDHPRVVEWVRRFHADRRTVPSLLLVGEPGTGKTYQAYAALREVVLTAARLRDPVRFRVITHPQFNHQLRPKGDGSHEHAIELYEAAGLLLFDDLGAGRQTDWTADGLYRLVDYRWSERLPTIYTSNLDPDDLATAVGDRVVSRVFDSMRVEMTGDDRRRWGGVR